MFNKGTTSASKSRKIKMAIAAICVIILMACFIVGNTTSRTQALTNVNAANETTEATTAATTEATTEVTVAPVEETVVTVPVDEEDEPADEEDETPYVPVYVPDYTTPPATEPAETEPTKPAETEPAETEPTYEELPEATEPEATEPEATEPEATEPEETEPSVHVHNFSIVWTKVNATCDNEGYTIYICDGCTETEKRDFVPQKEHNYIVYEGDTVNTYWCSLCGHTYQEEVTAPAPQEEIVPAAETEPEATEPAETEPAEPQETEVHTHECDPSDGHNHKVVKMGPFTYVYCEHVAGEIVSADGRTKWFPYSWCL